MTEGVKFLLIKNPCFFLNEYVTGGTIWCFLVRLLNRYNQVSIQANMLQGALTVWRPENKVLSENLFLDDFDQ